MVQLAVHQEPLHQVDVFLAGGAGAAERAALDSPDHVRVSLHRLTRLTRVTRTSFTGRKHQEGRWESNEGGDQTRSQDFRMWIVDCVRLAAVL